MTAGRIVFPALGLLFAAATYWACVRVGWSKLSAVLGGLVPLAICFFMGIIGVILTALFIPAVAKAAAAMPG